MRKAKPGQLIAYYGKAEKWAAPDICTSFESPAQSSEVASLRAQLHTQTEQRQFVGDLIENMPHAQIAAELTEFKAEVAAALEKLRSDWSRQKIEAIDPSESLYPDQQGHNSMVESFVEDLDAVITKLGLAPTTAQALRP